MRAFFLNLLYASSVAAAVIRAPQPVSYDGYKVVRVKTGRNLGAVKEKLANLSFDKWNHDVDQHMDIVIAPDQVATFEELGLDFHVMHENLGNSIIAESATKSTRKRQVDDLSWYDSYHPYEDHVQYFEDLHATFPNNSEIVSSGTSYEGRDLYGIHLWGADGPGKPAVLFHGTVHAREWISAPVSIEKKTQIPSNSPR